MVTTTETPISKQQKLYDNLKAAIKSGVAANVLDIVGKQNILDLDHGFNAKNPKKLYDLLDYTTGEGRAVAGVIFTGYEKARSERDFKIHLYNKIYDAIVSNQPNQEDVAEGILEFAKMKGISTTLLFNLGNKLKDDIANDKKTMLIKFLILLKK